MFALDAAEVETLVRLAAATADESNRNADGGEYDRALRSFGDPEEVHRLACSTWERIEADKAEKATVTILDEVAGVTNDRTYALTLTRLVLIGGHRVRIRIKRDYYAFQSHAVAEVYSADHKWTRITDSPPQTWHENVPRRLEEITHEVVHEALGSVADDLTNRTKTFLEAGS